MREPRSEALRRRRAVRVAASAALGLFVVALMLSSGAERRKPARSPRPEARPTGAAACGAEPPPAAAPKRYDRPRQVLEPATDYSAVIRTSCGDIALDLLEERAPIAVNNFVFLAREAFYDGLLWNRVDGNFVIQTGDPNGDLLEPPNGPGYAIPDEPPDGSRDYVFGAVAMAQTGVADSAGSQFFIVVHLGEDGEIEPAGIQPTYTIFGRVLEKSFQTLKDIARQPVHAGNDPATAVRPVTPIYVNSIEIIEG